MDVKAEKKQSCVLEVDVNIPQSETAGAENEAVNYFQSKANIPGFRKGKAPKNMVINRFKQDIQQSVLRQVLWSKLSEYIEKEKLKITSDPIVQDINYNFGEDLKFIATLELVPEFSLPEYKNISVETESKEINKEEEEKALNDIREKYSQFKSSDDGVIKKGHFAIIDYELIVDENSIEKKEATWVKITEDAYIKEFTSQLAGLKIGDEKEIKATLPENYFQKEHANKQGTFHVKVIDAKERVLPELDDAFAKQVGPYENIEALKKNIYDRLKDFKEQNSKTVIENQISDYLLNSTKMDLPPNLLLQEKQAVIKESIQRMHYGGLKEEDIKGRLPEIEKESEKKAPENLILHFVLEKIIELENIKCEDEDFEKEFERMSTAFHMPVEKIKERFSEGKEKESLTARIRKIKAIDFLINSANIKEIAS